MTTTTAPFILVFRPHQRPAWADAFFNDQDLIDSLENGCYATRCNAEWREDRKPTIDEAIDELGHDLHSLTRIDSADELRRYTSERDHCGPHNKGIDAAIKAGEFLGWLDAADSDDD